MQADADGTARAVALAMAEWPEVLAITEGGSRVTGRSDPSSDIDFEVYGDADVPVPLRRALAEARGRDIELDNRFWETGDEWIERDTGIGVDIVFRRRDWIEGEIDRVLVRHEASIGYTTCLWHNVRTARPHFDRDGWFAALQARTAVHYPEALVRAVVAKNLPLLAERHGAFRRQILKAAARGDAVSVNHRTAAFLASAFDVLFALNRTPHPGEKRMLTEARALAHLPPDFEADVLALLGTHADDPAGLERATARLSEGLAVLAKATPGAT